MASSLFHHVTTFANFSSVPAESSKRSSASCSSSRFSFFLVVAVRQRYFDYSKHMFIFQGSEIIMEQTASKERAMSSFTKRKGQTTYKVNVFSAENITSIFEDKLLYLVVNDIDNRKVATPDAE